MSNAAFCIMSDYKMAFRFVLSYLIMTFASKANAEVNLIQTPKKRLNFNGAILRVASMKREPYQTVELKDGKYVGSGFTFEILNEMARYFNFSYKIILPKFQGYGMKDKNGRWLGLIGSLVDKEADIAAAPFSISEERSEAVDFSSKLFQDEVGILIKQPKVGDNDGALLAPFNLYAWITIVIVAVLTGPILYIIQQIQYRIIVIRHTPNSKNIYNLTECIWFIYCGVMKQGTELSPNYDSTRMFFAAWWIFTLLLTSFYTANLTAFLSLNTYSVERTLDELLQSKTIRWIALESSAVASKTQNGSGTIFARLKESLDRGRGILVPSTQEALQLTGTGKYAFFLDSIHLDYITNEGLKHERKCILSTTGYTFFSANHGLAFQKNYSYTEEFAKFIQLLRTTGLVRKWIMQYLVPVKSCSLSSATGFSAEQTALALGDLQSAFVAYLCGIGFSLLVFLLEKLWHRRNKITRSRTHNKRLFVCNRIKSSCYFKVKK